MAHLRGFARRVVWSPASGFALTPLSAATLSRAPGRVDASAESLESQSAVCFGQGICRDILGFVVAFDDGVRAKGLTKRSSELDPEARRPSLYCNLRSDAYERIMSEGLVSMVGCAADIRRQMNALPD